MEDGGDPSFLLREEWAERPGEESRDGAVAARASRRSRPCHTRPCHEIAMVAGVGPLGTGILADAEFDQFRQWERTAAPVGTSGRMSISLPDCQRANDLASTHRVLAGFADGSAIGEVNVAERTRLSLGQAEGCVFIDSGLREPRRRWRGQVHRLTCIGPIGDN